MIPVACSQCRQSFVITEQDQAYYQRLAVPAPTKCPSCRLQLRLTFRNERTLYSRLCSACSKGILSVYSPDKAYTVYCRECWWSDQWNPLDYGQEIDWERPFFEQFLALKNRVPRIALMNDATGENSDYCNHCYRLKNCYMVFDANDNENTLYSSGTYYVKDSVDCAYCDQCQLCYETSYSTDCYRLQYSRDCSNCRDSAYLVDCVGVSNSLLCVGLRNVEYHYKNQPITPAEFEKLWAKRHELKEEFEQFALTVPRKYYHGIRNEDVSGDYINNSKSIHHSFQVRASEQCAYSDGIFDAKDCYDYTVWGEQAERMYEAHACGGQASDIRFCNIVWHGQDNDYCDQCLNGPKHCFGSVSLKNEQYCILNRQYSATEYQQLRERLIQHMTKTGEWGQFFAPALAPYAYNETMAMEWFPLTKPQALAAGWSWQDQLPGTYGKADPAKQIYACVQCQKNFKLIEPELKFYNQQDIPLPQHCPDCRYAARMRHRPPHQLWDRQCMHAGCQNRFQTAYSPDRKEIIYCDACYKKLVY